MRAFYLLLLCSLLSECFSLTANEIPKQKVYQLEEELKKSNKKGQSTVRRRRAYKNILRNGNKLLTAHPESLNRFQILSYMFTAQQRLLVLEKSSANYKKLLELGHKLIKAPNEFAELRFNADLFLLRQKLSESAASKEVYSKALWDLIVRYRDTPAEVRSLITAIKVSADFEDYDMKPKILKIMTERHSDNHELIQWRRENLGIRRLDVLFKGSFECVDGRTLNFPIDVKGHQSLIVFWSKEFKGIEDYLKNIKKDLEKYPNIYRVFSFNVDQLEDWGAAKIKELGLDWTVVKLPQGRKSQVYKTYTYYDPSVVSINAFGRTLLQTAPLKIGTQYKIEDARTSHERYLSQVQSLLIGDFLVEDKLIKSKDIPAEQSMALQACFVKPPFRYRLSKIESLAHYEKAGKLCRDIIKNFPKAKELHEIRNRLIIALIGKWNLKADAKYLSQASLEAKEALKTNLPKEAELIARFCLAKEALRNGKSDAIKNFKNSTKDSDASVLAASIILSIDANALETFQEYRTLFLAHSKALDIPSVYAFLNNRYHQYHVLQANYIRREGRGTRPYIVYYKGTESTFEKFQNIELKKLDGTNLKLPHQNHNKITFLSFVEPTISSDNVDVTANIKKDMKVALEIKNRHVHKEIEVITAFIGVNPTQVKKVLENNKWDCQIAIVPDGLKNPMIRNLGIYSADRLANLFMLRRDGTIAWKTCGYLYKAEFGGTFANGLALEVQTELEEKGRAYQALLDGDFQKAEDIFSGPFIPHRQYRFGWTAPRHHGRALARVKQKKWNKALEDIDHAIEKHLKYFKRHAPDKSPCGTLLVLKKLKAHILENLGRKTEAKQMRTEAKKEATQPNGTHYHQFHDLLHHLTNQKVSTNKVNL